MEESKDFPEKTERMHKPEIVLAKTFAPSSKNRSNRLPKPAATNDLVFFKTVMIVFSETVARLKESL